MLAGSEIIDALKTAPQNLACRVGGDNITGGYMGGSPKHVGVTLPEPGKSSKFFILCRGGNSAVLIDDPNTLRAVEVIRLEGDGAPTWPEVSRHPGKYEWKPMIQP